jgi:hypothetical protein
MCFSKCFWALNNVTKYDGKTNPNVWLEDYRLACRASGVDDDMTRAWLDHFPRNMINSWEDLNEIFTENF